MSLDSFVFDTKMFDKVRCIIFDLEPENETENIDDNANDVDENIIVYDMNEKFNTDIIKDIQKKNRHKRMTILKTKKKCFKKITRYPNRCNQNRGERGKFVKSSIQFTPASKINAHLRECEK